MQTFAQLAAHDHFSGPSTAPARVRRWLAGSKGLLPHSCTLCVYRDAADTLQFVARSLKTGSGVKIVFDKDFSLANLPSSIGSMRLVCDERHPNFGDFGFDSPLSTELSELDDPRQIIVQDSMETESGLAGEFGIVESWAKLTQVLLSGRDAIVNLTNLRPTGSAKSDGYNVTSSGPASFAEIYAALYRHLQNRDMLSLLQMLGTLNAVVLKGGHKRGIVTSMMHSECKLIHQYLDVPTVELDGSHKKGVILTKRIATGKTKQASELRDRIAYAVNTESIFLQKAAEDLPECYANTYSNVCVGIMLPDRGTCLLWRVNLGRIDSKEQLVAAYVQATEQIVAVHKLWHDAVPKNLAGLWQPIDKDLQVAIDPLGLANMLRRIGMSYTELIDELQTLKETGKAIGLVAWFAEAYAASTKRAQELAAELGLPPFLRLHTVEPAQSHAFESKDTDGYTTCRGIWPPFDNVVTRLSDNEDTVTVEHGPVETVTDIGPDAVFALNNGWQHLMATYGLPHAISADLYKYIDGDWIANEFWPSDLLTVYYQFAGSYDQTYARKQVEEISIDDDDIEVDTELPSGFCPLVRDPSQTSDCSVCAA